MAGSECMCCVRIIKVRRRFRSSRDSDGWVKHMSAHKVEHHDLYLLFISRPIGLLICFIVGACVICFPCVHLTHTHLSLSAHVSSWTTLQESAFDIWEGFLQSHLFTTNVWPCDHCHLRAYLNIPHVIKYHFSQQTGKTIPWQARLWLIDRAQSRGRISCCLSSCLFTLISYSSVSRRLSIGTERCDWIDKTLEKSF